MSTHFKLVCKLCGTVITQCRCPDPAKQVDYGLCDECAKRPTPEHQLRSL